MEIWATQYSVLQEVMAKCNITQENIAAIGITNQRENYNSLGQKYRGSNIQCNCLAM